MSGSETPELTGEFSKGQRHVLRELHSPILQQLIDQAPVTSKKADAMEIQNILDHLRLRFFFGGQAVVHVPSDRGPIVVSHADSPENLDFQISELNAQGHRSLTIDFPKPVDVSIDDDLPFFCSAIAPAQKQNC